MSEQGDFGGFGQDLSGGYEYGGGVAYDEPGGYAEEQEPGFDHEAFNGQYPTAEQNDATGREAEALLEEFPRLEDSELADAVVTAARHIAAEAGIPPQHAMRASFIRQVVKAHFPQAMGPTEQQRHDEYQQRILDAAHPAKGPHGEPVPRSQRSFWGV
jgi:hypothetical protein